MLRGIAFLAILIAAITSTFVARAARERERADAEDAELSEELGGAQLDDLRSRLQRVERMLTQLTNG
jgi:hypothetical protein